MLLRHARYLLAVADHGSFTRAAAELHVSQPALSQQIRQLEETLGAQLLDRSGRVVRPTDTGLVYIDHARRAVRHPTEGSCSWPRADNEILRPASRSDRTQATRNDRPILQFGFQRGTRAF